jgi:hypothetical protein
MKNKQAKIKEIKIDDRTYELIDGFTTLKSINKNRTTGSN